MAVVILLIVFFVGGLILICGLNAAATSDIEEIEKFETYVPFKKILEEEKELKIEPIKMVQFCQCCGAPINHKTIKCEYCGVEYMKVMIYK